MNATRYYILGHAGDEVHSLMRETGNARVEICRVDCVASEEIDMAFALANAATELLDALESLVACRENVGTPKAQWDAVMERAHATIANVSGGCSPESPAK